MFFYLLYLLVTLQIEDCITAVLDATVDEENGVIHHEVLEVDEDGLTPDKSTSTVPSTLEIIAKSELEVPCIINTVMVNEYVFRELLLMIASGSLSKRSGSYMDGNFTCTKNKAHIILFEDSCSPSQGSTSVICGVSPVPYHCFGACN